jgi:Lrp/AsnC family leucine-responsive transcriptional regulator
MAFEKTEGRSAKGGPAFGSIVLERSGHVDVEIDEIGWEILTELQRDGRIGYAELGRRVGLSPPAAAARVRRYEEEGIIEGYRAQLSFERLGLDVRAFVRMSVMGSIDVQEELIEVARGIPEILDLWRVTGAETYVMRVATRSVADLERVLHPFWQYGDTVTSVVMSHPITRRPIQQETVVG